MGIIQRLNRLDDKAGIARWGPRGDESRQDYLRRMSRLRWYGHVDPHLYREVVDLRDTVTELEARLAVLEARA